jgi:hypothetical protein
MGTLSNFLSTGYRDGTPSRDVSSFRNLTEEQLEKHMSIAQYNDFMLTNAVRPAFNPVVIPQSGYRYDRYIDDQTNSEIPVIMASISREILMDTFLSLLDRLGDTVDVIVETSHEQPEGQHLDFCRENIDLSVLQSVLLDFEDLLLDDGCFGIAVLNPRKPLEVQMDEHKLLVVYGRDNEICERVLGHYEVPRIDDMKFITEAEHVHNSSLEYLDRFHELRRSLGIDN